jgi:hypothetical protein
MLVLSAGGIFATFQPRLPLASTVPAGDMLQALQAQAGAIFFIFGEIDSAGSLWTSGGLSDSDFLSVLGSVLDAGTSGESILFVPSISPPYND